MTIAIEVTPMEAQTRFEWPSVITQVNHDTTVEDCLGTIYRITDSLKNRSPIWNDTVPLDIRESIASSSSGVIAAAKKCSARFEAETAPLKDFALLLPIFLAAGRDSAAGVLVHRRLAALPSEASVKIDSQRVAVLDSIIRLGTDSMAVPKRLAFVEPYLEQFVSNPVTQAEQKIGRLWEYKVFAEDQGDTARAYRWGDRLIEVGKKLSDAERERIRTGNLMALNMLIFARMQRNMLEVLDSLRRSTDGYVSLIKSYHDEASGVGDVPMFYGQQAAQLEGDFVFTATAGSRFAGGGPLRPVRPVPGRVNIVMMEQVQKGYNWNFFKGDAGVSGNWEAIARLQRIARDFPAVEITVVTNTSGWFGRIAPPPPEEEAAWIRKLWLGYHKMPGTLVVDTTDYWRIDPPQDRRRVDDDVTNHVNYGFGGLPNPGGRYLIDQDGRLILTPTLSRGMDERVLSGFIQALVQRDTQPSRSNARESTQPSEAPSSVAR